MFDDYLARWRLTPDGEPIATHSSDLLPVRRAGTAAMLKIAREAEERRGGLRMSWWGGHGAAKVLAQEGGALLLERATGEASRIICAVVKRLHAPRRRAPPELIPLPRWFEALGPAAARRSGVLSQAAATARELLAAPQEVVVLHGDIHPGNVLDFGPRSWLAIDPKGLVGERGFDYANLFCNPDLATATAPGRLARQATVVAEAAGLDRPRLLRWILAWAGLSAAWLLADGESAEVPLTVAGLAATELAIALGGGALASDGAGSNVRAEEGRQ
jgi:streptomycin 6-kinase